MKIWYNRKAGTLCQFLDLSAWEGGMFCVKIVRIGQTMCIRRMSAEKEGIMKKKILILCAGVLALALAACGAAGQQGTVDVPVAELKDAVVAAVGEDNYVPSMPLDAETLKSLCGVEADMYEEYVAEMPMISVNVDMLVIVKAKADKVDAVEKALKAYHDAQVADTMQYPMNLGKIQAGQVERIGNYVIYARLGADAVELETDEEIIAKCQEANKQAIEAIRGKVTP